MKLQKPKTSAKGILGTIIIFGIIFLVVKSLFSPAKEIIEKGKQVQVEKIVGFESLPKVMVGSGSMGALAGIVHGWKDNEWLLISKYVSEKGRIGTINDEAKYIESILKNSKLIGFKTGELDKRSIFNHEYKNCLWTIITKKKDTISFTTTEKMYAEKGNQSEWCTYFKPLNYIGK